MWSAPPGPARFEKWTDGKPVTIHPAAVAWLDVNAVDGKSCDIFLQQGSVIRVRSTLAEVEKALGWA